MTLLETAEIMKTISKSYPNGNKIDDEDTLGVWATMFSEDDFEIVKIAVAKHILTSKWLPNVAEIRECIADITRPDLIPPDEAWAMVNRWVCNTSEFEYDDIYLIFPTIIADTIEACGGKSTLRSLSRQQYGYSGKVGLDKLTFVQLYEPKYQRERQNAMIPRRIYDGIQQVQSRMGNVEYDKYLQGKQYIAVKKQENVSYSKSTCKKE